MNGAYKQMGENIYCNCVFLIEKYVIKDLDRRHAINVHFLKTMQRQGHCSNI